MAEIMVEMKKISEFGDFDPKEFCVKPSYWGYDMEYSYHATEAMEKAKELAASVDGICIAIVHTITGDFVLGESCSKGCSSKFILFNATGCYRAEAEVRAITYNTGRGALSRYWYDKFIKYQPGSEV